MTIYSGISPISLFTVPILTDRDYISVNSRQTDDSSFNPNNQPLSLPVELTSKKSPFVPFVPVLSARLGVSEGGVNSFMYNRFIRQSGTTRLDGQDVDLGQIREDKEISYTLWNGFNEYVTLTDIAYSYPDSGVEILLPEEDEVFRPLAEHVLNFTVTLAGDPLFNVDITLTFSNGYVYEFTVRGSRLIKKEFTFLSDANWNNGLTFTNNYLTSIMAAGEISETRLMLRSVPQRQIDYEIGECGKDFVTAMWGYLQGLAKRQTYAPLWHDVAYVTQDWTGTKIYCDTRYKRFYAGKTAIICRKRYDHSIKEGTMNDTALYYEATVAVVEDDGIYVISSPVAEIFKGDTIYPGILSEIAIDANDISCVSPDRTIVNIAIDEVYGAYSLPVTNPDYTPDTSYGVMRFDFDLNWSQMPKIGVSRPGDSSSSGRGTKVVPYSDFSRVAISATVSVHTREDWWELAGAMDYIKGRYRSFWVKSPLENLRKGNYTLYSGANLTEVGIIFTGGVNNLYSVQALWITSSDGTEKVVLVTGLREAYGGGYILELDPTEIADIVEVRQAFLCRNNSDKVQENWLIPAGVIEVKLNLIELSAGYAVLLPS